ncbi:MAG: hypothetical protein E7L41_22005 [Escherichia coli]|nr:hypothetical protein [Escherichia coli]
MYPVGVVSSPAKDEAADPFVRFRDRIVTDAGTLDAVLADLGDALGGVLVGAGSFDRADCTLASSRCICAVSERMCVSELDAGSLCVVGRVLVDRFAGVRRDAPPDMRGPAAARLSVPMLGCVRGLGVALLSSDGRRDLRGSEPYMPGALAIDLRIEAEASDMGGDGGSCTSETVCATRAS